MPDWLLRRPMSSTFQGDNFQRWRRHMELSKAIHPRPADTGSTVGWGLIDRLPPPYQTRMRNTAGSAPEHLERSPACLVLLSPRRCRWRLARELVFPLEAERRRVPGRHRRPPDWSFTRPTGGRTTRLWVPRRRRSARRRPIYRIKADPRRPAEKRKPRDGGGRTRWRGSSRRRSCRCWSRTQGCVRVSLGRSTTLPRRAAFWRTGSPRRAAALSRCPRAGCGLRAGPSSPAT